MFSSDKENEPTQKKIKVNEQLFFPPEQEGEYDIPFDEAIASLQKEWAKS